MTLFETDPSVRWLFCFTHPDDELSIAAWIKRLVGFGSEVFISWTHSNPIRESEARSAAELMGVPQCNLMFMTGADGEVYRELHRLQLDLTDFIEAVEPDRVVCGAFEQGHIDHDATNFMVNQCFSGPVIELPFYHAYCHRIQKLNRFAQSEGQEVIFLSAQEQKFKRNLALQYPSQNIWNVLVGYDLVGRRLHGEPALAKSERMRWQTHKNFLTPHLPHKLAKKVERTSLWRKWKAEVAPLLETGSPR